MSRKWKIIIPVGLAMLLLATVFVAPVMADDDDVAEPARGCVGGFRGWGGGEFLANVAEELGVSEDELQDAVGSAAGEMIKERARLREDCLELDPEQWQARRQEMLDQLVADGVLTADEAEDIQNWWGAQPEACSKLFQAQAKYGFRRGLGTGFCPRPGFTPEAE
jgi:hypothetical protein